MALVNENNTDTIRVVAELTAESSSYRRQFVIWLGVGSGAGIGAMLTFAEKFADPIVILHALLPSLVGFAAGIVCATASVLFASFRDGASAGHHASSHNRSELAKAIRSMPQVFSAPQRLANEMNFDRNKMIERHDAHHADAEGAWGRRALWKRLYLGAVTLSIIGFLTGIIYPLVLVVEDSKSLYQPVPPEPAAVKSINPAKH